MNAGSIRTIARCVLVAVLDRIEGEIPAGEPGTAASVGYVQGAIDTAWNTLAVIFFRTTGQPMGCGDWDGADLFRDRALDFAAGACPRPCIADIVERYAAQWQREVMASE